MFGLVVPPGDYYYPEIIRGVQEAARTHGARVVLAVSGETLADNREQVRRLVAAGAEGLLLMPRAGLEAAEHPEEWLADLGVPVVLVDRRAGGHAGRLEQVASDHAYGAGLAVRHLAGLGHRRIAFVARSDSPNTPLIQEGYAAACRDLGLVAGPCTGSTRPTAGPRPSGSRSSCAPSGPVRSGPPWCTTISTRSPSSACSRRAV
ncbi:substrate-binding domain-containing protein [Streptomyces zhihengii]